jgi:hypothetical protein
MNNVLTAQANTSDGTFNITIGNIEQVASSVSEAIAAFTAWAEGQFGGQ